MCFISNCIKKQIKKYIYDDKSARIIQSTHISTLYMQFTLILPDPQDFFSSTISVGDFKMNILTRYLYFCSSMMFGLLL